MPKTAGPDDSEFARAVVSLEAELRQRFGLPQRLADSEIAITYPTRSFTRGWRISVRFEDGLDRRIDLLVNPTFPVTYPRTALVDRPDDATWPHVERDGVLCLLPIMAEIDPDRPAAVALNLLGRSARLIEELLAGHIVDRDFREEFLTYWFYNTNPGAVRVESLVSPSGPTRLVSAWRDGKGAVVVGEDPATLEAWLRKSGREGLRKSFRSEPAVLLWRSTPPLPNIYPLVGADILALTESDDDRAILAEAAAALPDDLLVLVAAEGRGGAGLIAMTTTAARKSSSRTGHVEKPLTRGFRAATIPPQITIQRTFGDHPVLKSVVHRADPEWIHGRGKDSRASSLLGKRCAVIGCGSVGSSVAARLARAGVGKLRLVDHDALEWSNIGRHELGARSVGLNKAEELARRLSDDFPHLAIEGMALDAHSLIRHRPEVLTDSDLVLVATGSWRADNALNKWHLAEGRLRPFLYGWTESHASAAHAVIIAAAGGCLRCGIGATGRPTFEATSWPNGATLEEPACGNHFQPYGAIELGFVVDHICDAALSALLTPPELSRHLLWLTRTERMRAAGGEWTDDGRELLNSESGGCLAEREWPSLSCSACQDPT